MRAHANAMLAMEKEWNRLRRKGVWDEYTVMEWPQVCAEARKNNTRIYIGRVFGVCVEKGSARLASDPSRTFKYRVVFQGHNVTDQTREWAIFQDLGSNPAIMHAGKNVVSYAGCLWHCCEQSDADQAYVQAWLSGS